MNWRLFALIPAIAVLLAACAVEPPDRRPPPPPPPPAEEPPADPDEPPPVTEPEVDPEPEPDAPVRGGAAVVALQTDADTASAEGEHGRAASLLERALRIEPHNPVLWHNLAVVRYREGDYAQAESMAMRSNRYADGRRSLMQRNWQLIAVARELAGDEAGAGEARQRAERLGGGG